MPPLRLPFAQGHRVLQKSHSQDNLRIAKAVSRHRLSNPAWGASDSLLRITIRSILLIICV
jgi:hypothetical protein